MSVGERIKARRLERGWTMEELARRAGVSQPAVAKAEARVGGFGRPKTGRRYADALGIPYEELLGVPGPEEYLIQLGVPRQRVRGLVEQIEAAIAEGTDAG